MLDARYSYATERASKRCLKRTLQLLLLFQPFAKATKSTALAIFIFLVPANDSRLVFGFLESLLTGGNMCYQLPLIEPSAIH